MIRVSTLVKNLDSLFKINSFKDVIKNGLIFSQDLNALVEKVGLAVDLTPSVLEQILKLECNFVLLHHSPIFRPLDTILPPKSNLFKILLERNVSVYVSHIPMDCHKQFSHSRILAKKIGLKKLQGFPSGVESFGVAGFIDLDLRSLEKTLDSILKPDAKRLLFTPLKVQKVAIVSGSGGSFIPECSRLGVQLLITGEAKYSDFIESMNLNVGLWLYGHHNTEVLGLYELANYLSKRFDFKLVRVLECEFAKRC